MDFKKDSVKLFFHQMDQIRVNREAVFCFSATVYISLKRSGLLPAVLKDMRHRTD